MKWSAEIEKLGTNSYRFMFTVGVQGFIIAQVEDDDEAERHCWFIRNCFLQALVNLGVPGAQARLTRYLAQTRKKGFIHGPPER